MLVKVAVLVLVTFERITALGGLPSGSIHCQLNLPSPATVQERVRLGERLAASSLAGAVLGRREGGTVGTIAGRGDKKRLRCACMYCTELQKLACKFK